MPYLVTKYIVQCLNPASGWLSGYSVSASCGMS